MTAWDEARVDGKFRCLNTFSIAFAQLTKLAHVKENVLDTNDDTDKRKWKFLSH